MLTEKIDSRLSGVDASSLSDETNFCFVYILSGMVFFSSVNFFTRFFVPISATKSVQSRWKWRNVLTSVIHSIITGLWSSWAFYAYPKIRDDMIYSFNTSIHVLVSVSIGYFIYDFFDMFIYHKKRSTYELLIHHFMVILCYVVASVTKTYVAYATLSLVVEINSIFLHTRQLLIIGGIAKQTSVYRITSLLNVASFVLFRILLLGWMTRWLTLHRDDVPVVFFTIGSLGLSIIMLMSIILFYRVLQSDFLNSKNSIIVMNSNDNPKKENSSTNGYRSFDQIISRSVSEEKKCQ